VASTTEMAPDQRRPPVWMFRALNPFVRALLRSPLARLLEGRLMLLAYRGRRSGREFAIPIGYFAWDDGVLALSSARWWVNLRDGQPVQLLIRGQQQDATATVYERPDEVAARLLQFVERLGPKAARGLMLGLPSDRKPTAEELSRAAKRTAVIQFHIEQPEQRSDRIRG
jgi:hypothetical protein